MDRFCTVETTPKTTSVLFDSANALSDVIFTCALGTLISYIKSDSSSKIFGMITDNDLSSVKLACTWACRLASVPWPPLRLKSIGKLKTPTSSILTLTITATTILAADLLQTLEASQPPLFRSSFSFATAPSLLGFPIAATSGFPAATRRRPHYKPALLPIPASNPRPKIHCNVRSDSPQFHMTCCIGSGLAKKLPEKDQDTKYFVGV